jgi:hypothetical protein
MPPPLSVPLRSFYFFFLLAFFAVEAFFLAMLFASSLSGVRAEGAGPFSAYRKLEMFHGFLSLFRSPAPTSHLQHPTYEPDGFGPVRGQTTRDSLSPGLAY